MEEGRSVCEDRKEVDKESEEVESVFHLLQNRERTMSEEDVMIESKSRLTEKVLSPLDSSCMSLDV